VTAVCPSKQAFVVGGKEKINVTGFSFGEGKTMSGVVSASNCCRLRQRLQPALIGSSPMGMAPSSIHHVLGIGEPTEVPPIIRGVEMTLPITLFRRSSCWPGFNV
jgi:hypothetical protein